MKAHAIDRHLVVPKSRSLARSMTNTKVTLKNRPVLGALVFHKQSFFHSYFCAECPRQADNVIKVYKINQGTWYMLCAV